MNWTAMPEDYVMVARVAVFMRGLGTFLQHPISIAKAWRPLAIEVLKEKEQHEHEHEPLAHGATAAEEALLVDR